ncbi:preprotein translocase subunit Tim44 [Zobellella endophytica]|uniref:Preprotein translocase subunit Tim44 n=1 Tax=Zobellella endophytica TaxID=2116700 RepID=A0A2P7R8Q9_9GAMM|nr:Tim44-like domain-containing protein [Zobellella endophytica]PSJ46562.1 preprotein translocase subunit Tim44 [Zobellella endophytica]
MRKLLALFTLIFAVGISTTAFDAEARKLGGGSRSVGKSYQTAPSQPTQQNVNRNTTNQTQQTGKKSGLMGGLLGGLLAGGLFAYLLGSGAFEGFQFMDFLLIAGLAFAAIMIFRMLRQTKAPAPRPAYGGPQQFEAARPAPANGAASGFGASEVPFNLPPNFDMQAFLQGSREHYRTLQQAWNQNDLEKIREYVSPELFAELSQERARLSGEQHTEVMFVDAELVRADHSASLAQVSLKFSGRYRDSHESVEQDIREVWHLERDLTRPNAPWLIVGLEDQA